MFLKGKLDRLDSSPADQFMWNEKLGHKDNPYLTRWGIVTRFGSIRLHKWKCGDDDRNFHDHPWWFVTIVLSGSYADVSPDGEDKLNKFSVRYRPAHHKHTVVTDGALTLLITGPEKRRWGFWIPKANGRMKFVRAREYFFKFGHHHCD